MTTTRQRAVSWPRRVALALRLLAMGVVAAAVFAPDRLVPSEGSAVVYVVDESHSTRGARESIRTFLGEVFRRAEGTGQLVCVVRFDGAPTLTRACASVDSGDAASAFGLAMHEDADAVDTPGSDLQSAVRLATAALPDLGARRIVVLTDGRETRGQVRDAVAPLSRSGVAFDVVSFGHEPAVTTHLGALERHESHVRSGESVRLEVDVVGQPGERVRMAYYRDGARQTQRQVNLDGEGRFRDAFVDHEPSGGVHVYEAQILRGGGAVDRTRRQAAVLVGGKPRVLVVTLLGDQPTLLVDALRQADADVTHLQLTEAPLDASRLSGVDLVVLADLPLERAGEVSLINGLGPEAQDALVEFVGGGGGLIATGGAFGFGPDWADTPLARIMPVHIEDQGEVDDPPVALAVMLDRSGSMGARVGSHSKMELAVEASLAAAATLRPTDRIGIATVDTNTTWTYALADVAGVGPHRDRVRRIRAGGGGIYVYTALVDAYDALRTAPEPIRHVILFSDTADSEEQYQGCPFGHCGRHMPYAVDLAREVRALGLTTSVVGIGSAHDSDVGFLQDLAAAGGGRFYLTTRGADLRRIFVTETRAAALSNLREEPTGVEAVGRSPMVDGVGPVPELSGFVQSQPRPTADTALRTTDGHPLLASWRHGLGTVVAFTSDAGGRWSQSWSEWPGAGQLMRQMARFAQRRRAATSADAAVSLEGDEIVVDVRVPAGGEPPAGLEIFAHSAAGGTPAPVTADLERVGPGHWRARTVATTVQGGGAAVVVARARDAQGGLLAEALGQQSAASEWSVTGPDQALLSQLVRLGEGRLDPSPAETLVPAPTSVPRPVPTWPWWLLAAAALVVMDLFARRLERSKSGARRRLGEAMDARRARSRATVPNDGANAGTNEEAAAAVDSPAERAA